MIPSFLPFKSFMVRVSRVEPRFRFKSFLRNFFRLLCSVYLPQKVRGIFTLKTQKTGLGLAMIAIPKPVFAGFTVFWAISALKARKLPDLSGRQIRQLFCDVSTKRSVKAGCLHQKYAITAVVGRCSLCFCRSVPRPWRSGYSRSDACCIEHRALQYREATCMPP